MTLGLWVVRRFLSAFHGLNPGMGASLPSLWACKNGAVPQSMGC